MTHFVVYANRLIDRLVFSKKTAFLVVERTLL